MLKWCNSCMEEDSILTGKLTEWTRSVVCNDFLQQRHKLEHRTGTSYDSYENWGSFPNKVTFRIIKNFSFKVKFIFIARLKAADVDQSASKLNQNFSKTFQCWSLGCTWAVFPLVTWLLNLESTLSWNTLSQQIFLSALNKTWSTIKNHWHVCGCQTVIIPF